jgi:hypothetical protein
VQIQKECFNAHVITSMSIMHINPLSSTTQTRQAQLPINTTTPAPPPRCLRNVNFDTYTECEKQTKDIRSLKKSGLRRATHPRFVLSLSLSNTASRILQLYTSFSTALRSTCICQIRPARRRRAAVRRPSDRKHIMCGSRVNQE